MRAAVLAVSLEYTTLDLTALPAAAVGDEATLVGQAPVRKHSPVPVG